MTLNISRRTITMLIIVFSIIAFILIGSCAQTGSISGGPKDTIAPVLLRSFPKQNSVNFEKDQVVFQFNEFLQLKDVDQQLVISPPFDEKPKVQLKGKKVFVKFEEKLMDSITYSFNFKNSITDFNEGNPIEDFRFALSTGNVLDTFQISGKLIDAYTDKARESIWVMLYAEHRDSLPYLNIPLYVAKTDTGGYFSFHNIKPLAYKLFALNSTNFNYIYDQPNEEIAFTDSIIHPRISASQHTDTLKAGTVLIDPDFPTITDTLMQDSVVHRTVYHYTPDSLTLKLFREDNQIQHVFGKTRPKPYVANLSFTKPLTKKLQFRMLSKGNENDLIWDWNIKKDSVNIWVTDSLISQLDTIAFEIMYPQRDSLDKIYSHVDTVFFEYGFKPKNIGKKTKKNQIVELDRQLEYDSLRISFLNGKKLYKKDSLKIITQSPIKTTDLKQIKLYEVVDTTVSDTRLQKIDALRPYNNIIHIQADRPIVGTIQLTDISNKSKAQVAHSISFSEDRKKAEITLKDSLIASLDTIRLLMYHQNKYFFNENQELNEPLLLGVRQLELNHFRWVDENKIEFKANKPLLDLPKIEATQNKETVSGTVSKLSDLEYLFTFQAEIDKLDFIKLKYEADDWGMKTIDGKQDLKYSPIISKVKKKSWYTKDTLLLDFYQNAPEFKAWQLAGKKTTALVISRKDQQAYVPILSEMIESDTARIIIELPEVDSLMNKIVKKDTLQIKINANAPELYKPETKKIKIPKPIESTLLNDSSMLRSYFLQFQRKYKQNYILKIRKSAFTDIYGTTNDSLSYSFSVADTTDYASIHAKINFTDSLKTLEKAYLQLVYPKEENIDDYKIAESYEISIPFDKEIKFVKPEKLEMRIFIDQNNNGIWDTGKYLKHIQPEYVRVYPNEVTLKANWVNEIVWKIKP